MSSIKIILYALFVFSIVAPVYTYAIYPFGLKLFRRKKYVSDCSYKPQLSVVIFFDGSDIEDKIRNIRSSDYSSEKLDIGVIRSIPELNKFVSESKSDLLLLTDTKTKFDTKAVSNLISRFKDDKVGCVCGQLRKKPDKDGKPTDSMFWKYENKIKQFESGIGRLSGANNAIYAVRKSILPQINEDIISLDFYISTYILQAGWDVVMAEDAVVYEAPGKDDGTNFKKHVCDGMGYYQALLLFWRMLLPRKGSFTYVSHRAMKWLVPINIIIAFITSAILSFESLTMTVLFICQFIVYALIAFYNSNIVKKNKQSKGLVTKIFSIFHCFFILNLSYLVVLVKLLFVRRLKINAILLLA